jgi:hypothetical protein
LRVEFDPQQRFHCRAGANGTGYDLYVNQQVSLPNDFSTPVVPDLLLTLTPGTVLQGSFRVGSTVSAPGFADAIASIAETKPVITSTETGNHFELDFNAFTNMSFSIWASTNLLDWEWMDAAVEVAPGQYQFRDAVEPQLPVRFYRIGAP